MIKKLTVFCELSPCKKIIKEIRNYADTYTIRNVKHINQIFIGIKGRGNIIVIQQVNANSSAVSEKNFSSCRKNIVQLE